MTASQLFLLCIICTCEFRHLQSCELNCGTTRLAVNKTLVESSWQSSVFRAEGFCFQKTADELSEWDYFYSGESPDSSGYQWLLLKLTRGVRVQSVTVHARAAEQARAQNIEVLLSEKLPSGLVNSSSSCHANLAFNLTGFRSCGRTEGNAKLRHTVVCPISLSGNVMQFILLKKYVANETDKYLNFERLQVSENASHVMRGTQLGLLTNAWQSSYLNNNSDYCYVSERESIRYYSGYFHSDESFDPDGYQWLLLNLSRGVSVLSVTLHARNEVPERASNVEVLVADQLPTGLLAPTSHCQARLQHSNINRIFSLCGRSANGSTNASLNLEVQCNSSGRDNLTRFILLRKYVRNTADKYLNFMQLDINEYKKSEVGRKYFTDSWQSSAYRSEGFCFRQTADRADQEGYFHSGDSPDSSGYQWLLLKLTHGVRVQSVFVHPRSEVPCRAQNVEILLGDSLPAGLLSTSDSCIASLSFPLPGFLWCGETGNMTEVRCNAFASLLMTRYVLLRKNVTNETDKFINWENVEIQAAKFAQVFVCTGREFQSCSDETHLPLAVGNRSPGSLRILLPCQLAADSKPACDISSARDSMGNLSHLQMLYPESEIRLLFGEDLHGQWQLQCSYQCVGQANTTFNRTIDFDDQSKPSRFALISVATVVAILSAAAATAAVTVRCRNHDKSSPNSGQEEPVPLPEKPGPDPNTVRNEEYEEYKK